MENIWIPCLEARIWHWKSEYQIIIDPFKYDPDKYKDHT